MAINGFRANAKTVGNAAIAFAARQSLQNIHLALRQFCVFFYMVYARHSLTRDDALPRRHARNTRANFRDVRIFDKQSVYARIVKLLKQSRSRAARNNSKTGFGRPMLSFRENLKPVRTRHAQIQNRAVWLMALHQRYRLNTIFGCAHNAKAFTSANRSAHAFNRERMIIGNDNSFIHNGPEEKMSLLQTIPRLTGVRQGLLFLVILLLGFSSPSLAQEKSALGEGEFLSVSGAQDTQTLTPHMDYLLDPTWELTLEDMRGAQAENFIPIPTLEPDFGYIDSRIWLRLGVQNNTENINDWRIYVRENFLQYYDVYIVREDGHIDHIESHNPQTRFSQRSTPYPELVSPFRMEPDEAVTVFIAYWSGGSSHAAVSLETSESFSDIAVGRTSKNYISYGMMMILILVATFALFILRLEVFWAYLCYVASTLIYLMHIDGVAFQYFWPNAPVFNSYFTIVIGTIFVVVTYNFARVFLQTKIYHPAFDKLFRAMIITTPLITITGTLIDPQGTKLFIFVLIFMAILLGTIVGLIAAMTRFRQVRFYLFAWICGILTAGLMNLRHNFGLEVTQDTEFEAIRISIVVDAIMMGLGVADRYRQSVQKRQQEADETLEIAQRNLRLNKRLFDLEEQFKLASELVISRDDQMRETVHDIRQPLHALRLSVQKFEDGQNLTATDKSSIDQTFSYLEDLIASHLKDSVIDPSEVSSGYKAATLNEENGELSLSNILSSIHNMFLADASEKDLIFKYVPTSQNVSIEPLAFMRAVNNLVSNAIKYTPNGKVLLGVKRQEDGLSIQIHDTGPGMSAAEFEQAKQRGHRLDPKNKSVEGHGYGLTIAHTAAQDNGWTLRLIEGRQTGTSIALDLKNTP